MFFRYAFLLACKQNMILVFQTIAIVKVTECLFPIQACVSSKQFQLLFNLVYSTHQYQVVFRLNESCVRDSKVNSPFVVWSSESELHVTAQSAHFFCVMRRVVYLKTHVFVYSMHVCVCVCVCVCVLSERERECTAACGSDLSVRSGVCHFQQHLWSRRRGSWEQHGRPFSFATKKELSTFHLSFPSELKVHVQKKGSSSSLTLQQLWKQLVLKKKNLSTAEKNSQNSQTRHVKVIRATLKTDFHPKVEQIIPFVCLFCYAGSARWVGFMCHELQLPSHKR